MSEEGFLSRWSRRKRDAIEDAVPARAPGRPEAPPPAPLPALEELTFASDYAPFLQAHVPAATRRAALKKLFAHTHFNQLDRLDIHMEDYNVATPVSAGMLAALQHVQSTLGLPDPENPPAALTPVSADREATPGPIAADGAQQESLPPTG